MRYPSVGYCSDPDTRTGGVSRGVPAAPWGSSLAPETVTCPSSTRASTPSLDSRLCGAKTPDRLRSPGEAAEFPPILASSLLDDGSCRVAEGVGWLSRPLGAGWGL